MQLTPYKFNKYTDQFYDWLVINAPEEPWYYPAMNKKAYNLSYTGISTEWKLRIMLQLARDNKIKIIRIGKRKKYIQLLKRNR